MVICTDYKSKDKFSNRSNRTFLEYLYDNIIKLKKRSSHLMVQLQSSRANICTTWWINFIPNVIRGFYGSFQQLLMAKRLLMRFGGNVKSIVQSQSMGKRNNKIIVQDAKSFYQVAKKAMNATGVFSIHKTHVEAYRDTDLFNGFNLI